MGGSGDDWKFSPNRYGPFGWIETILKGIGAAVGIASLAAFDPVAPPLVALRIIQVVCVGLSFLIHLFLVVQRFFYREVFAFFFSIVLALGHLLLFIVLFQNNRTPGTYIFVFNYGFWLGEIVHIFYFLMQPPKLDWADHTLLEEAWKRWLLAGLVLLVHFVSWVVQIVIWTTTFIET